jgi:MFS family permease
MSWGRARPWLLVAPATALLAWGGNHFTPLLLMYRQVDGYSSVEVDLFLAFYILGLVPGFLIGGPLADRHGRKRVMVTGIALSALGSAVLAAGASSAYWLCAGRLVVGVSVAVAMVAGTAWIEELSRAPYDEPCGASGARRASLALTAGFGIGAGISGALAQWAPAPTVLPYVVQVALLLAAAVPLRWAPETVPPVLMGENRTIWRVFGPSPCFRICGSHALRGLASSASSSPVRRGRSGRWRSPTW